MCELRDVGMCNMSGMRISLAYGTGEPMVRTSFAMASNDHEVVHNWAATSDESLLAGYRAFIFFDYTRD